MPKPSGVELSPTVTPCTFSISTEASVSLLLHLEARDTLLEMGGKAGRHNNPEGRYRCYGDADSFRAEGRRGGQGSQWKKQKK